MRTSKLLAGFILHQLGHIPAIGESFVWRGWRFEVVDLDAHRNRQSRGEMARSSRCDCWRRELALAPGRLGIPTGQLKNRGDDCRFPLLPGHAGGLISRAR